jgi:CHAT domain-containing protein
MKWTILFLLFSVSVCAQDCDEILKFKAEEYYINVSQKPDSLNQLSCKLIQRQLEPGSVFIDISESEMNHQPIFIVLIIAPKGEPEVIEIPIKQDAGKNSRQSAGDNRGGKTQSSSEEEIYSLADYKNFWSLIEPAINGSRKIYYSSSRLLNLVNLKFIRDGSGDLLFNNYEMVRLHSGASFLGDHKRIVLPRKMDVLLVGGLRYDCRPGVGANWDYLPGTRSEINDIHSLLAKAHYIVTIDSCLATEAKLSAAINAARYDVVHIATHGFYFSETEKGFGVKPDTYPMERGGIVLSGGNSKTATIDIFNQDGLFTAMEMQQLNLSNIRFMVLSTCHSGEGDASENTAPLGMTLAMMRNGIQAMMVSNRAVPDKETSLFMKTFYTKLASNGDLDQCYLLSIRELHHKFPETDWSFFDLVH